MPDKSLRRVLLKPLKKREISYQKDAIVASINRLDHFGHSQYRLASMSKKKDEFFSWENEKKLIKHLSFIRTLYEARRISFHEYVFHVSIPIEHIHNQRVEEGAYPEIEENYRKSTAIEKKYGLEDGEFWRLKDAPKEYRRLARECDQLYDVRMVETFREFKLIHIAELYDLNKPEFASLRERGRRTVFHKDEAVVILKDLILSYERQAKQAAESGAYLAAITSLGSGLEGVFLLRCLRSRHKAIRVASKLPAKKRPAKRDACDPTKWTFDTLIETCLVAEWLLPIETEYAKFDTNGLAHMLRLMRNNIHPGKLLRENPWWQAEKRDYQDAEDIYRAILYAFTGRKK